MNLQARTLGILGLAGLLLAALAAQAQGPARRDSDLKEGAPAPDFTIKDVDGKMAIKLSELKGKPVVLIFGSCT
jgi:cytochrome oxidase Cu insertion factor (SCO1/SenC/PrrC family)